jgi:hypothetical protein
LMETYNPCQSTCTFLQGPIVAWRGLCAAQPWWWTTCLGSPFVWWDGAQSLKVCVLMLLTVKKPCKIAQQCTINVLEFAQQSSQWVNMDQNSSLHSAEIDLQDPSRMSWHIAFIALEGNWIWQDQEATAATFHSGLRHFTWDQCTWMAAKGGQSRQVGHRALPVPCGVGGRFSDVFGASG